VNFNAFFQAATGDTRFDYPKRLAGGDAGADCQSQLIDIPTGLRKGAAVVMAWLWNRIRIKDPKWPRRLTEIQTD
jgi:CRISPR-associated endonuclease/helicase Cas3